MNYKPLAALFIATALSGCNLCPTPPQATTVEASPVSSTAPSTTEPIPTEPIPKATSNKVLMNGWEVAVTGVKSSGRIYKGDGGSEYEAADAWTAVSIAITNKTGKRQRDEDAPGGRWSEMLDSTGKKYDAVEVDYVGLKSSPYAPGEVRSEVILFDSPKNIKPVQLILDEEGSPRLKLR